MKPTLHSPAWRGHLLPSSSSPFTEANPTYVGTGFLSPAPDGIHWDEEHWKPEAAL